MSKTIKIAISITCLLLVAVCVIILNGFYGMEIEDYYGDHQQVYYESKEGDIAINFDTKESGVITKTSKRIYCLNHSDTVDIMTWLETNTVSIYRSDSKVLLPDNLTFEQLEVLIKEKELKLVIQNKL